MLAIVGLVVSVFAQTADFAFLEWDDATYVRDNPHVLAGLGWRSVSWALTSFAASNWHPLTWWSHQMDVSLFGQGPGPMHLVNVLFHGMNSLMVGMLLLRFGLAWVPAMLAAALFAVHPLHVESVVWIAERKDVLSTFFLLLALLSWDCYIRRGGTSGYVLALLLAALGLMAKPMLVTLPGLLLILDGWPYGRLYSGHRPWFRDRQLRQRCIEKIPFALLSAASAWLTLAAQAAGGAIRPLNVISLADRLENVVLSYATYLLKTLLPTSQSFLYPFVAPELPWVGGSFVVLAGVSWWATKRQGPALAGWLWFLLSLVPVIGLVAIGDHARADRYMYVPMIGLLLMAAGALPWTHWQASHERRNYRAALTAAACAILALAFMAHRYAACWRDSETLFQQALAQNPRNHVAHTLLAITYEHRGNPRLTLAHADSALDLAPRTTAAANAAVSASNAAIMLGDTALAKAYLERAIEAAPGLATPHYNLGTLALKAGDPLTAKTHFEQAIALDGNYSQAYNNLGVAFLKLGQVDKALAAFAEAVRSDPDNRQARNNLARTRNGSLW